MTAMPLAVRLAVPADQTAIERLVIAAFEPITWQKKLDERFGPLNGCDWQARWHDRLQKIFATQIVLLGAQNGDLAAVAAAYIACVGMAAGRQYVDEIFVLVSLLEQAL